MTISILADWIGVLLSAATHRTHINLMNGGDVEKTDESFLTIIFHL